MIANTEQQDALRFLGKSQPIYWPAFFLANKVKTPYTWLLSLIYFSGCIYNMPTRVDLWMTAIKICFRDILHFHASMLKF
jgi:hypothetical protein